MWVRLPRSRWPPEWKNMTDPVVKLLRALYGLPESPAIWQRHFHEIALLVGWIPVADWESCYVHKNRPAFMVVYVDDVKIAAPRKYQERLWTDLRKDLRMDDPAPPTAFLGCTQETHDIEVVDKDGVPHKGKRVLYSMKGSLEGCVEKYSWRLVCRKVLY